MGTKTTESLVSMLKQYRIPSAYISDSQCVNRRPWIRDQLPGDPWIQGIRGYRGPVDIGDPWIQGIRGYISVLVTSTFTYFLIKRIEFCYKQSRNLFSWR